MVPVGRFRPAANPRFVVRVATFWACAGAFLIVFAFVGPPRMFDDLPPERAGPAIAQMRNMFLMIGGFIGAAFGGLRLVTGKMALAAERSLPSGDRAGDPIAWMVHASRAGTWRGPLLGRTFEAALIPRRHATAGFRLSLFLDVPTRLAWMRRPAVGRMIDDAAGMKSIDGKLAGFPDLELSAADEDWASRLYAAHGMRRTILELTHDEDVVLVILRPGRLFVQYPYGAKRTLDEDGMRRLAQALVALAEAAEANGPPAAKLERNRLERFIDGRQP